MIQKLLLESLKKNNKKTTTKNSFEKILVPKVFIIEHSGYQYFLHRAIQALLFCNNDKIENSISAEHKNVKDIVLLFCN